jgi:hypothetical protein
MKDKPEISAFKKNFLYIFCGLECVGHSFAYVAYVVFLRDFWIPKLRAAVASRRATNYSHPSPKDGMETKHDSFPLNDLLHRIGKKNTQLSL